MRNASSYFRLIIVISVFLFGRCENEPVEESRSGLRFITEIYKPLNYTESGEITGLAPEVLKEICRQLYIPFKVSVMTWDEGYQTALQSPSAVLFSTSMNSQRKDLFKWAGPIASLEWKFYALARNPVTLDALDEARQIAKIGVLKDYTIEQYLVNQGFTNLVYCSDHQDAIQKLLNGSIDLYPSDRYTTEATMEVLGQSWYLLKEVLPIKTELIYYAFNKAIPDQTVSRFQEQIDKMKQNGSFKPFYEKFMRTSGFPGILQIYTEEYPPITFMDKFGEISGYGSDIVREIMKRNRIFENITISTWSNGYELALDNPNFCLFTMDRTGIRESLFQWVGPVGTNTTWFYVRKGSGLTITSLDDAKKLPAVGTVSSWFSDQHLRKLGFTNLISGKVPAEMATKLMQGKIDAFVCTGVTFPDILKEAGYQYADVMPAYALMSSDYYISFSKNTPISTVQLWQSTFDSMVADGTVTAIRKKWFPD